MTTKKPTPPSEPEAFDDVMKRLQLNVAAMASGPELNMTKSIAQLAESMTKSNQGMLLALSKSMPKIVFPSLTLYMPNLPVTHVAPKVELVGGSDLKVMGLGITSKTKAKHTKKQFGLYFIKGESVKYKGKTLRAFSLETQHGQLLKMLLDAEGRFVSDKELLNAFNKGVIYDVSHILRNLKNAFKINGLQIIIERRRTSEGYVLVDIQSYK